SQGKESISFSPLALVITRYIAIISIACLTFTAWSYWRVSQLYVPQADRAAAYQEDTIGKLRGSWMFQNQVQFAELTTTLLAAENAAHQYDQALELLHFSPEPRVIEKLIESAVMLGRDDKAEYYMQRFKVAFPKEYAQWSRPLIVDPSASDKTP
ncbi:MAG: Wzy polymerase domain-containing protein, partial [Rhodoferax sp.]